MKKNGFLFVYLGLIFLTLSCNRDEVQGVSDEDLMQEFMYGGWKFDKFECQLDYSSTNPLAVLLPSLREELLENIQERLGKGVLYFKDTVVYFAQTKDVDVLEYYRGSYYDYYQDPSRIELSNTILLSGAYTPVLQVKQDGEYLVLYLTREQTLDLIKNDNSIEEKYVSIIDKNIDDAQFEFYLRRVNFAFFDEFE